MPQKKNPDVAELMRGKSGRVVGNLVSLLVLMKGQPLAYNRDNQEDKEPLFDSVDTITLSLEVLAALVPAMRFDHHRMSESAILGYPTATDLADYLVVRGVPFRDAHAIVGKIVQKAVTAKVLLSDLPLDEMRQVSDAIDADVYDVLTLEGSVAARKHIGGTAPERVREAAERAREALRQRQGEAASTGNNG